MAFNGSGVFNRIYNWVNDKANGYKITASRMDGEFDGIATGLSNCITKDGQTTISANIPFSTYKITGLGSGTARTDAINVGQVQDNQFLYLGTTSGSADAYTLAPSPAITAYTATQQFTAKISATNLTTTPYLQLSAIANPTTTAVIKKLSATKTEIAVAIGDLVANGIYTFKRNSANDAWIVLELSNPATTTNQGVAYLNNPITIANNATDANNDIDFSAGTFQSSDGSGQSIYAGGTGQLDVLFGTGNGMLATGTKAINSTYHLFMVSNPTTGVSKPLAILGIAGTAPDPTSVLPSGYTRFERRGSILTDGSGNIRAFTQINNHFLYTSAILDVSASNQGTSAVNRTISTPLGIKTLAQLSVYGQRGGNGTTMLFSSLDQTDVAPSASTQPSSIIMGANVVDTQFNGFIRTNLSSQIRTRWSNSDSSTANYIFTVSYQDLTLKF